MSNTSPPGDIVGLSVTMIKPLLNTVTLKLGFGIAIFTPLHKVKELCFPSTWKRAVAATDQRHHHLAIDLILNTHYQGAITLGACWYGLRFLNSHD
jgi:hypothetical protein